MDHSISGEQFNIKECSECSLWLTSPRPEIDQLGSYYHSNDYISHSDTSVGFINKVYKIIRNYTLRRKLALVKKYLQNGRILDVGCGAGYFLDVCRNAGFEVSGIEPDNSTRQSAIKKFELNIFPEEFLDKINDDHFDLISMWHVLEHVPEPEKRLLQLFRILKPGAALFVAVPNRISFDARHYGPYWAGFDVPRHLWHFSPNEMKRIASKTGFSVQEIRPMYFDSFYVSMLSEKYKKNRLGILQGIYIGCISNIKALLSGKNQYSSQIYILVKSK